MKYFGTYSCTVKFVSLIFAVFYSFIFITSKIMWQRFWKPHQVQYKLYYTKICQNPITVSLRYGDLTIFKIAAVRHLGFWKFAVFVTWRLSACRSASWCKISLISDNWLMSYGQQGDFQDGFPSPSRIIKISIFGHVVGFNIWCSVPSFIKIGRFFTGDLTIFKMAAVRHLWF